MDKFIAFIMWSIITIMEVILLVVTYILGTIFLLYKRITGRKNFINKFIDLSKQLLNDLGKVFKDHRNLVMGA